MKKIAFTLLFLLICSTTAKAADFKSCKALYNDDKYNQASYCFYYLVRANGNDVQARSWYAASLFFDRKFEQAYTQYNYLAQKYPNTEIGKYSKNEAEKVRARINDIKLAKAKDSGNYIKDLETCSKWSSMPIRVWIQPSLYSLPSQNAFSEWQSKTSNLVSFTYVQENRAQIKVYFVKNRTKDMGLSALGITNLSYNKFNKQNISAKIVIHATADSGKPRTSKQVYPVVLHEIGHALGLTGHSRSNNDIMYTNNYTNDTRLSNRDINTIKAIYNK